MRKMDHDRYKKVLGRIGYRNVLLLSFFLLFILASVTLQLEFTDRLEQIPEILNNIMEYLGFWAPIVFVLLYIPIVLFFLPAWPLSLAGGIFFGIPLAPLYIIIGATLGGSITFLLVRYLDRGILFRFLEKRYQKYFRYYRFIDKNEITFIIFLHFTLLIPYTGLNYILGISKISFKNFLIGTLIGSIPASFFYAYLGFAVLEMEIFHFIMVSVFLLALLSISYLIKRRFLK